MTIGSMEPITIASSLGKNLDVTQGGGFCHPLDSERLQNIRRIRQAVPVPRGPKATGTGARSYFFTSSSYHPLRAILCSAIAWTLACQSGNTTRTQSGDNDMATLDAVGVAPTGDTSANDLASLFFGAESCSRQVVAEAKPKNSYVPAWFDTPEGYRNRLIIAESSFCVVSQKGALYCQGVFQRLQSGNSPWSTSPHSPLDLISLADVVDLSVSEFDQSVPIGTDSTGSAWWWHDCFPEGDSPPFPPKGECSNGTPEKLSFNATVLQTASGGVGGGVTPVVLARVQPGRIMGIGRHKELLGIVPLDTMREDDDDTGPMPYTDVVSGVEDFVQLRSGWDYVCGLRRNREVVCWGAYGSEMVGTCVLGPHLPRTIPSLQDTVDLSLSARAGCAIKSDGSLWCWGVVDSAGDYDPYCPSDITTPKPVSCLTDARLVAMTSYGFRCVAHMDGAVSCTHTGYDGFDGLRSPTDYYPMLWPGANVSGIAEPVVSIATYFDCACVLGARDGVYCWGDIAGCFGLKGDAAAAQTWPEWTDEAVLVAQLK